MDQIDSLIIGSCSLSPFSLATCLFLLSHATAYFSSAEFLTYTIDKVRPALNQALFMWKIHSGWARNQGHSF